MTTLNSHFLRKKIIFFLTVLSRIVGRFSVLQSDKITQMWGLFVPNLYKHIILFLDIENKLHKETKLQCIKMVDLGSLPLWVIL